VVIVLPDAGELSIEQASAIPASGGYKKRQKLDTL
jgi:hypothetical protein